MSNTRVGKVMIEYIHWLVVWIILGTEQGETTLEFINVDFKVLWRDEPLLL